MIWLYINLSIQFNNETVYLNNKGKDKRDYTYIKDLIN